MTRTNQQIFDTIWVHLNKQGYAATNAFGTCSYNGQGGAHCAVGCLLTPDALAIVPEHISVAGSLDVTYREADSDFAVKAKGLHHALALSGIDLNDKAQADLLIRMQALHDRTLADTDTGEPTERLARWRREMAEYANKNGLMPRPIDFQLETN